MTVAREWLLRRRPQGWPVADDVELVDRDLPEPRDGQVLVRNLWLSVDPYTRGRMNAGASYAAPYELDRPMEQAALACLRPFGRVAACGTISSYNEPRPGPDDLFQVVGKKLRVQGFIVSDSAHREPVFRRHVGGLLQRGEIRHRETVREGIESTFDALLDVLRGGRHVGKLLARLGDPAP